MVEFFFRIIIIGLSVCSYESAVQISGTASHAVVGENFTITCSGPPDSLLIILENNLTNFPVYVFLGANTDNTCIPSGSYNTDYFYSCANDSVIVTYNTTVPGSFMKEELHNSEWTCRNPQTSEQQSLLLIVKKNTGKKTSSSPTCDDVLIYVVHFILTIFIVTFVAVIFIIMKRADIGSKYVLIVAAVLIDVVLECIVLWGFEYGLDFQTFKTNDACNVVIIGVVCHVVIIVILLVKVVVLIRFTERIQECMGSCCDSTETTVESGPLTNRSNDHATKNGVQQAATPHANNIAQPVTTPEDITLLMHFQMPSGYQVHHWVKEDSTSLQDSSRHVPSDRGTLHIKSATAEDNGIYQSLLVSGNSELRVNVILHVTGLKSVSLMVDPFVWRQIKNKKLKQIHDLKKISKHLSINNVEGIPSNLKRSEETDVTVKSIRWTHNGKEITGPSPWKSGNNHLQCLTVQRETPIDEYHCRIEFSDRKSHIFIFIVKFTGSGANQNLYPSDSLPNNKVDTIEEVVGVPTIINTKREETDLQLKPLRETAMTTTTNRGEDRDGLVVYKNDFNQMTARSGQSTEREEQL